MNDLLQFTHGDEGEGSTHAVCIKHNVGTASVCCECTGKTDCADERPLTSMEKPCCSLCVPKDERWACSDPSCKCHLPKEKCECATPELCTMKKHSLPEENIGVPHCFNCGLPIKQTPAPEKKWEAAFEDSFGAVFSFPPHANNATAHIKGANGIPQAYSGRYDTHTIKSFIRQLLEEKAVEVEKLAGGACSSALCGHRNIDANSANHGEHVGKSDAFLEAAAILRR